MKREANKITDPEQVHQFFENKDNKTMKLFQERIELAHKFNKDIKDKIYSGEKMSIKELKKLKLEALEYKGILEEIDTNPKHKIFLNLSENREKQGIFTKRLHETIINAINGLETSVNIIETRIEVSTDNTKPSVTGFQSSLNDKQIEKLFDQMQTYIDGNLNDFKAIFQNEPLP